MAAANRALADADRAGRYASLVPEDETAHVIFGDARGIDELASAGAIFVEGTEAGRRRSRENMAKFLDRLYPPEGKR